ncbi:MAG: hypothetical protein ACOYBP_09075 [Microbacteriaceae bacterium]
MNRQEKCNAVQVAIRQRIHDLEVEARKTEIAAETDIAKLLTLLELWEKRAEVEEMAVNLRELDREWARRWLVTDEWKDPYDLTAEELGAKQKRLMDSIATLTQACPEAARLGVLDEAPKSNR